MQMNFWDFLFECKLINGNFFETKDKKISAPLVTYYFTLSELIKTKYKIFEKIITEYYLCKNNPKLYDRKTKLYNNYNLLFPCAIYKNPISDIYYWRKTNQYLEKIIQYLVSKKMITNNHKFEGDIKRFVEFELDCVNLKQDKNFRKSISEEVDVHPESALNRLNEKLN